MFKKIFKYLEPAWTGADGKISLRAVLAIAFSIDFIRNLSHAIWSWDGGRSLEGLSLTLGIEAGLIVGLLGLTTLQNTSTIKADINNNNNYLQSNGYPQSTQGQSNADKTDGLPRD